jgi:DNA-binding response OmpR family regulator
MTIPDPPQDGKFRILVIEDDSDVTRLIQQCLSGAGFDCRCASDGSSGLKVFNNFNPHLVLLDLMMPGVDGEQACLQIRATSSVPVIILTAKDLENTQLRVFKIGADDFIAKPFSLKPLLARVVAHLRRVYRYDVALREETVETPSGGSPGKAVPPGWATCEACGYVGPQQNFRNLTRRDLPSVLCPNCQRAEHVVFSLK